MCPKDLSDFSDSRFVGLKIPARATPAPHCRLHSEHRSECDTILHVPVRTRGGDIILTDKAPMSTSTNKELNFKGGGIGRIISAPKGTHAMYVDPVSSANDKKLSAGEVLKDIDINRTRKESEVLFQPGTKTRLVAIWYDEKEKTLRTLEETA